MSGAREQLDNEQMERLQNRITKLEQQIQSCPFFVGTRRDVVLGTTPTQVAHGLGRIPKGVLVLSAKPSVAAGFSTAQPADTKNFVNVQSTATATCSLWFF